MKKPKILKDLDIYANALATAVRWHNSDQSICFGNENCQNPYNRFYIHQFLDMMEELESLNNRKFRIYSLAGKRFQIPRNLQIEKLGPKIIAKKGRERHYFPKFQKAMKSPKELQKKQMDQSVLIKITPKAVRKPVSSPPVRDGLIPGMDPVKIINSNKISKYKYYIIKGLPGNYILATRI